MAHRQVLLWAFSSTKMREGLSGCALPRHRHRHCTYVSFTAVLGMDVLPHCVSGQRLLVSNASIRVLDALRVSAGKTDEDRTLVVLADAVHESEWLCSTGRRLLSVELMDTLTTGLCGNLLICREREPLHIRVKISCARLVQSRSVLPSMAQQLIGPAKDGNSDEQVRPQSDDASGQL
jgi:hypothetical protein